MSSRRRINRKLQRKDLIEKLRIKCPVCGKTAASSEEEAWELARRQFLRFGGEMPKRVYQCMDNIPFFHWTRMEKPPLKLRPIRTVEASADFYSESYWADKKITQQLEQINHDKREDLKQ